MTTSSSDQIRQAVRENYGQIAETSAGCCDTSCCTPAAQEPQLLTLQLGYTADDMAKIKAMIANSDQSGTPVGIMNLVGGVIAAKVEAESVNPTLFGKSYNITTSP